MARTNRNTPATPSPVGRASENVESFTVISRKIPAANPPQMTTSTAAIFFARDATRHTLPVMGHAAPGAIRVPVRRLWASLSRAENRSYGRRFENRDDLGSPIRRGRSLELDSHSMRPSRHGGDAVEEISARP
jgi:hypothetical protein